MWDGRRITAEFTGPDADTDAARRLAELEDAGGPPELTLWRQRTCSWVNTVIRADPQRLEVLEVEGSRRLSDVRALGLVMALHRPTDRGCAECGHTWPCQTYRLVTTSS